MKPCGLELEASIFSHTSVLWLGDWCSPQNLRHYPGQCCALNLRPLLSHYTKTLSDDKVLMPESEYKCLLQHWSQWRFSRRPLHLNFRTCQNVICGYWVERLHITLDPFSCVCVCVCVRVGCSRVDHNDCSVDSEPYRLHVKLSCCASILSMVFAQGINHLPMHLLPCVPP